MGKSEQESVAGARVTKKKKKSKKKKSGLKARLAKYQQNIKKSNTKRMVDADSIRKVTAGAESSGQRMKKYISDSASSKHATERYEQMRKQREADKVRISKNHWEKDKEVFGTYVSNIKKHELKSVMRAVGIKCDNQGVISKAVTATTKKDKYLERVRDEPCHLNLCNCVCFKNLPEKTRMDVLDALSKGIVYNSAVKLVSLSNSYLGTDFLKIFLKDIAEIPNNITYLNLDVNRFDNDHTFPLLAEFVGSNQQLSYLSLLNQIEEMSTENIKLMLQALEKNTKLETLNMDLRLQNQIDRHRKALNKNINERREKGHAVPLTPRDETIAEGKVADKVSYEDSTDGILAKRHKKNNANYDENGKLIDHIYTEKDYVANIDWDEKQKEIERRKKERAERKKNAEKPWQRTFQFSLDMKNKHQNKCPICGRTAYLAESIDIGVKFHKRCFRCNRCGNRLTVSTYAKTDEALFCKQCFKAEFMKAGGKYSLKRQGSITTAKYEKKQETSLNIEKQKIKKTSSKMFNLYSKKSLLSWVKANAGDMAMTMLNSPSLASNESAKALAQLLKQSKVTATSKSKFSFSSKCWKSPLIWIDLIFVVDQERKAKRKKQSLEKLNDQDFKKILQKVEANNPDNLLQRVFTYAEDRRVTQVLNCVDVETWDKRSVQQQVAEFRKSITASSNRSKKSGKLSSRMKNNPFLKNDFRKDSHYHKNRKEVVSKQKKIKKVDTTKFSKDGQGENSFESIKKRAEERKLAKLRETEEQKAARREKLAKQKKKQEAIDKKFREQQREKQKKKMEEMKAQQEEHVEIDQSATLHKARMHKKRRKRKTFKKKFEGDEEDITFDQDKEEPVAVEKETEKTVDPVPVEEVPVEKTVEPVSVEEPAEELLERTVDPVPVEEVPVEKTVDSVSVEEEPFTGIDPELIAIDETSIGVVTSNPMAVFESKPVPEPVEEKLVAEKKESVESDFAGVDSNLIAIDENALGVSTTDPASFLRTSEKKQVQFSWPVGFGY